MANGKYLTKIDGHLLRKMIISGTNKLTADKERINSLNVFPVPDGDTGTNMSLTAIAAAKEVEKLDTPDIFAVAKAAASGALRGGRGNSGVIFSQLFRGFSRALEGIKQAGPRELAAALSNASKTAYKAVMRPQEGTMLTISRHVAEAAESSAGAAESIESLAKHILEEGYTTLKKTPDMLPVLKQAGVVDSGADGLLCFLSGAFEGMSMENSPKISETPAPKADAANFSALHSFNPEDITFTYCTEFIINAAKHSQHSEGALREYLDTMGDSIALVSDDEIIKVHIHTDHPGAVMEHAMSIGPLSEIDINNMRFQHQEATAPPPFVPVPDIHKEVGVVTVCAGRGFAEIFADMGVDYVIEGGQTMNPSAEDIAHGINQVKSQNVIVLPNNKNIFLAAQQAGYLCENKNVEVIESKTVPQGIAAMINYIPENSLKENSEQMAAALKEVATGQITYAVRDSTIDGFKVASGDHMSLLDGKIVSSHQDLDISAKELINTMMSGDPDILTIYTGEGADDATTAAIGEYVEENYGDCDLEIAYGGQPVYSYIISAE